MIQQPLSPRRPPMAVRRRRTNGQVFLDLVVAATAVTSGVVVAIALVIWLTR